MKEIIKHKMMNRLHRRNSSSSSTASVDFASGERLQFNFSGLQALQVPKGWDKLSLSIISVETGKTLAKTGRALVHNGNCRWTENLSEYIWVPLDDASKGLEQCLYKLLISTGSGRSGILGEVTVNLSNHLSSDTSISIAEPLKNCSHGTILQVEIRCLTPLQDRSLSEGGSISSFESMDDSFRNLSEVSNGVIGRQDSLGSSNSSYHGYDSPKNSGKHILTQRQDSGRISHSVSASPLRTSGPTEFLPEGEGATVEELRAEARMWERNARKLKVDLDFLRKESRDQTRKLENATMEVLALHTECDGMKNEITYLKVLLDESAVKEQDAESLKDKDKDDIQTELEEELKFQRELNHDLSLQLNKTQESNLELVSILQELEEDAKKREVDGTDSGNLKIRCDDLERKCVELEVNIQGFKDKACSLEDELTKYHAKAEEGKIEVAALKQLLKLQKEGKHEREGQAEDNGEQTMTMIKDPCNSLKINSDTLEKLNMELLAKNSEIEVLKSDCLVKDKEIEHQRCHQRDLKTQLSDLQKLKSQFKETMKTMQTEGTIISECLEKVKNDMVVLSGQKDSQVAANKILEKKLLEVESCNKELETHLGELELENLHLSERISGLEPQLRYLTDARESSRLEIQHSETRVVNLEAEIRKLEDEIETNKVDTRQKLENMQKRWLEAQEECEYLKKANPKLQSTAENLIEESSALQKSNRELKQQRLELYNRCTSLEAELKDSRHSFLKLSRKLEDLEGEFSVMVDGISRKEKLFDSELENLHLVNEEQTEKLKFFSRIYLEKMAEIDKLTQIYGSPDERDRMASEAELEMHVLRSDKDKLENSIEDFRSSYEARIQDLTVELAASKQNHGVLEANLEKLMELLENTRSDEEKLRITVADLDVNLKKSEYERLQLTEEILRLEDQLQKIPVLQDEVVGLKKELNDVKYESERLEASLQMITGDYEELKEEKSLLLQKTCSMKKAVVELEDHKRSKVALEEQIIRLQGDLTAREALSAQEAELKNELGRLKRSNSQLQWKINSLQQEKDECMKNAQVLEEKLEQIDCSTNNSVVSFGSEDAEASTTINEINKEHDKDATLLESELKELQERYLNMSLKYAQLEAEKEEVVIKLKAASVRPGKSWFS